MAMRPAMILMGAALSLSSLGTTAVMAAQCGNTSSGFESWKAAFTDEMRGRGFTNRSLKALDKVSYSNEVIRLDRSQKSFKQSFEKFYARRSQGVVRIAKKKMKTYARTVNRVEEKYGVPRELLLTIWGLETGFGHFNGNKPIFQSLATLAYDCRRTEFFTAELVAALTIVERRQIPLEQMKGAWAGEIGQTQFLPTRYVNAGVSFDGDRRVDLYRSVPDVLASTANWFAQNGWRRGQPYGEGTANYKIIQKWNRATVYQRTIAKLAQEMGQAL
ncbi:MAG: lytic murein transglycosylase [Pseudomonadota bacterium]